MEINLRDWQLKDLPFYQQFNTGHHAWMDFDGPYYDKMNEEELATNIKNIRQKIQNKEFSHPRSRMVIESLETHQILGTVSCYWESKETNWLCIGLAIYDENNWGKGIGYKALVLWCDYLFQHMPDLVRLDMRTWSGNIGLMKLAEKMGFKLEACFRKARIVKGEYYDSIGYGILREEFYSKHSLPNH